MSAGGRPEHQQQEGSRYLSMHRTMQPPPPPWGVHAQPRLQARSLYVNQSPLGGGLLPLPRKTQVQTQTQTQVQPLQHIQPPSTLQAAQEWYERSARADEKAKTIFSTFIRAFQSAPELGTLDVNRLLNIHLEQPVRSLDKIAAQQALKCMSVQEKQWSTEPNGQGFRMAGREAKGYIDRNNIDPTRMLFSMSETGLPEARTALSIAEESVGEQHKASLLRQAAKEAANMVDIPLYTELDSFLELAEQHFSVGDEPTSAAVAGVGIAPAMAHDGMMQQSPPATDQHPLYVPQQYPPGIHPVQSVQHVQQALVPPTHPSPQFHQPQADHHQLSPIIVKEGHLASTGTFDRRSQNTWNDLSPRFDGGIPNLSWAGHEEMLVSGPTMAAMATDVMDDFNSPVAGVLATKDAGPGRSSSSAKEADGRGAVGMAGPGSATVPVAPARPPGIDVGVTTPSMTPTSRTSPPLSTPPCFCGDVCERAMTPSGEAYFGCKTSKCGAQIPISSFSNFLNPHEDGVRKTSTAVENPPTKASKRKRDTTIRGPSAAAAAKARVLPKLKLKGSDDDGNREGLDKKEKDFERPVHIMRASTKVTNQAKSPTKRGAKGSIAFNGSRKSSLKASKSVKTPNGTKLAVTANMVLRSVEPEAAHGSGAIDSAETEDTERTEVLAPVRTTRKSTKGTEGTADVPESTLVNKHLIERELELIPSRLQCKKPDKLGRKCLRPLRSGTDGRNALPHLGRCRYKPRDAVKTVRGMSDASVTSASNISSPATYASIDAPHASRGRATGISLASSCKGGNPEPASKHHGKVAGKAVGKLTGTKNSSVAKQNGRDTNMVASGRGGADEAVGSGTAPEAGSGDGDVNTGAAPNGKATPTLPVSSIPVGPSDNINTSKVAPGDAGAVGVGCTNDAEEDPEAIEGNPVSAAKAASAAREVSKSRLKEAVEAGKRHTDGQDLLRREFADLSSSRMASSYGCSSTVPHDEWLQQKKAFLSQCDAVRAHPALHTEIVGRTDIGQATGTILGVDGKALPHKTWTEIAAKDQGAAERPPYRENGARLFARTTIPAGDVVAELVGEVVSAAEATLRKREYSSLVESEEGLLLTSITGESRGQLDRADRLMFVLNSDWTVDATRAGSSARFARQLQDGNCRLDVVKDPAGGVHLFLQSLSELNKGDEITLRALP